MTADPHPMISRLYDVAQRDDRATLAELRRGLQRPLAALPFVVPFLRRDASQKEEEALTLVASLFAMHPQKGTLTLAQALAAAATKSDSIELRFRALLDCDLEDLPTHLRHAVSLARGLEIGIDYGDLLTTVQRWDRESRSAQRAWARDFWTTNTTMEDTDR